ncbi:hypothetical protein SAMN02745216_01208 [Desulfatibacillum alkenivorans DSM 16219]|jgi:DNA repair exonuclease SbcCD ATPase subunit|uniref:Uncharacterized protein n=1 Tax=Desulfatibacillum alkenivorans DSM 16219 TaxID=1121393 RepID=A0A1M6HEZ5_9BACT|nr:hypothetical protein [Desulfatibacillum alkenivorans]SHJ20768.1 hypothetical protein SAMN02745216_01208 [Desulfatibacillum alkenivorans DSM 16219]
MRESILPASPISIEDGEEACPGIEPPAAGAFAGIKPTYEQLQARVEELERENRALKKYKSQQKKLEQELSDTLTKVLAGYLPICARCKRIREENGVWKQLETYIQAHSEVVFSHSLCPACAKSFYPEFLPPEEE